MGMGLGGICLVVPFVFIAGFCWEEEEEEEKEEVLRL